MMIGRCVDCSTVERQLILKLKGHLIDKSLQLLIVQIICGRKSYKKKSQKKTKKRRITPQIDRHISKPDISKNEFFQVIC